MPIPFLAPDDLERAGLAATGVDGIRLANPLVAEESVLRTSLLPGLLKAVARNEAHRTGAVRLYELGRVYHPSDDVLPDEFDLVAGIGSGHGVGGRSAGDTAAEAAVAQVHRLAAELGLSGLTVANAEIPGLHPTRAAEVVFRGRVLGSVGEIDPRVLEAYEVAGRASWFELRVEPILAAIDTVPRYRPISLYPSSDIDLAFVTPADVAATDVARTIRKAGDGLIRSVRLFDVFRSAQLGEGRRSLAFQVRFQADDRTLTDGELSAARQRCIEAVETAHGATLRG
jgi:phenylalanyl-tRNA synthetase beta chain